MEHKNSLKILGLTEKSSLQDLTAVFRKLVKKYHPDLNQDKQEWSNQKMLYLNEVYNSAHQFLSLPQSERFPVKTETKEPSKNENTISNISFSQGVVYSMNLLHDGIGLYYQYGLENIALRNEGTRRSRFRSSVRRIKKSYAILKPVSELYLDKNEVKQLEIMINFIHHFYKSMHISSFRAVDNSPYERKAFQHFTFGSKMVDSVIKEIMFREFLEPYKLGRLNENIKLAEAELNAVIIDYPTAYCHRECEIKKELLLSFLEMNDLHEMGLINLYN